MPARTIVGGVLNRVDLQHHGYYYSQYYRREYSAYYKAGTAPAAPARATKAS